MAVLLRCIIDLSATLDTLNKTSPSEEEIRVFEDIRRTFVSLCELELDISNHSNPYQSSGLTRELCAR